MKIKANQEAKPLKPKPVGKLYGVWQYDANDWLRELPSQMQDGGEAILAFTSVRQAQRRAADNYACDNYTQAKLAGWTEVFPLA